MSSYQKAIAVLSLKKSIIQSTLNKWERKDVIGRAIVSNIFSERFLPQNDMVQILSEIYSCNGLPINELEERYKEKCYQHGRKGGAVRVRPIPNLLGRAVTKEDFISTLFRKNAHYFASTLEAENFLERILQSFYISPKEENLWMSNVTAWVTWSTISPNGNPFDFATRGKAEEVRSCLGLEPDDGALLLLVYERPYRVRLHRPTIADADVHPYFQPAGATDDHGLTRPWLSVSISGFKPKPRPEAVHKRVKLKELKEINEIL